MPPQTNANDQFRESLKDVVSITERLRDLFLTTEELHDALSLALINEGQLKLLMGVMTLKK